MPFQYAIQCDRLQSNHRDGEVMWAELMLNAKQIDTVEFLEACELETLVDEGESFEDFTASDDTSACFHYSGAHGEVYFIQTSGFEFFFTEAGQVPSLSYPIEKPSIINELARNAMAKVMLPPNSPLSNGSFLNESQAQWVEQDLAIIERGEGACRLLMYDNDEVVAGINIENNVVESLYVKHDRTREGLATRLFRAARDVLGDLEHSNRLTDEGEAFVKAEVGDTYGF